jgi:hypothetical protein
MCVCVCVCVCTRESSCDTNSSTLEHDGPQHDREAERRDSSPAWQRVTADQSEYKGGSCNIGVGCTPSSYVHSRFRTPRLPSFWPPEACVPRMPCYGGRRAETAFVKSCDASVRSFTRPAYSVLRTIGEIVLILKDTLWKNILFFVKDMPMIYVNVIIISWL